MGFKNYFALTSRERNGFFAIIFLCMLVLIADYCIRVYIKPPPADLSALQDSVRAFYASANMKDTCLLKESLIVDGENASSGKHTVDDNKSLLSEQKIEQTALHIEINTATKDDLMQIRGIGEFYAEQIIKLRNKYGGFSDLNTLQELYGMDEARLTSWKKKLYVDPSKVYDKLFLNSADSIAIAKIPCLSRFDAQRIVRYRERLGGFYSAQQLLEVYGIKQADFENIMLRAVLDTVVLRKIDINNAEFKIVMKHPYIDGYENTKAIFRYLDLMPISTWDEFCQIPNLHIKQPKALMHYLDFNPVKEKSNN